MSQHAQTDFTVLTVVGSSPQGRAHVAFEHAEDGFDLPSLAIGLLGETLLHQLAIASPHRAGLAVLSGPTAIGGRNDATDI